MKNKVIIILVICLIIVTACTKHGNRYYQNNPEPLLLNAYIKLPLGSVKPEGWLKSQLQAQAEGLTGNLDDFWPDLVNSAWRGGSGEAWERGPYYLDGLVPLAYLLDDKHLTDKVNNWIEKIIASSSDSGWYGPAKNKDRWPLAVANKVLMQYYETTGDMKAIEVLKKYFKYLHNTPPDWPDKEWRGVRAMENAVTGYWLFRQTKEPWILETIETIQKNSSDWTTYYEKFPWDSSASANKKIPLNWGPDGLTAHVVNNAMAIKYPGLWYQQSKDLRFKKAVTDGIKKYDLNHGQTGGRFSGDEHLSGKSPSRGTELCSVVEYMFSLENLYEIFGDNVFADRIELLAFNSLPGTTTPDFWAHQYDQQSNQVLVSGDKRDWSTNGNFSNIYGFSPNFGCCLANMHQGWPKFAESMWMATNDNGIAAVLYGPSSVKAKVGKGNDLTIKEETNYPFTGEINFKMSLTRKTRFPLYLRIPGWEKSVTINFKNKSVTGRGGETIRLEEKWNDGDVITMRCNMDLRYETRFNNSISVIRGPLYFSLRIDKDFKRTKTNHPSIDYMGCADWEIIPKSEWNWGLMIDRENLSQSTQLIINQPGIYPFSDKGDMIWSADSSKFIRSEMDPPLMIRVRAMKIKSWTMINNSAADPPESPVSPEGDPEVVTLIPYGCARLRITEFPLMDVAFMTKQE